MKKELVLFGDAPFAEVAYEYFTHDSSYKVVAFTVNEAYIQQNQKFGLPVLPFETIEKAFPPGKVEMHIALTYGKLNRLRMRVYGEAKAKGYTLANYVSSRAFVWHNVEMGDNNFIFEDNTVQPFVRLGSDIVLWSGNHIGHHSSLGSHNFISSHVVISGFCNVGESCFFGVNSTVANNIDVGRDAFIGAGALITKSLPDGSYVKGSPSLPDAKATYLKFGIDK